MNWVKAKKIVKHVQSCCLANLNLCVLPFSLTSPSSLLKLPTKRRLLRRLPPPRSRFWLVTQRFSPKSRLRSKRFRVVFGEKKDRRTRSDSRSSLFAPKPHGNACYTGYPTRRQLETTRDTIECKLWLDSMWKDNLARNSFRKWNSSYDWFK